MIDIHNHCKYSFDSQEEPKEMIETAIAKGAEVYGFADHINLNDRSDLHAVYENTKNYIEELNTLGKLFSNVKILRGIEFDFNPDMSREYVKLAETFEFDYIINSVHTVGNKGCYIGYFDEKTDIDEGYHAYFDCILDSLDAPYPFHVLGHFGFLLKSAKNLSNQEYFFRYQDKIREILQRVIDKGIALEANTSTYGSKYLSIPDENILRLYYEMGGRKISIGADAHTKERVMENVSEVLRLLKKIGFESVCYFEKGQERRLALRETQKIVFAQPKRAAVLKEIY